MRPGVPLLGCADHGQDPRSPTRRASGGRSPRRHASWAVSNDPLVRGHAARPRPLAMLDTLRLVATPVQAVPSKPSISKHPIRVTLVAALIVVVGLLLWSMPWRQSGVTPQSLHPHLTMAIESGATVEGAIHAWGVPSGALNAPLPVFSGQQYVVGHLTYTPPATKNGHFAIFLIDTRFAPGHVVTMWGVVPNPKALAGNGWDWRYDEFSKKYPWLASLATIKSPDGSYTDPASTFGMESQVHGPVTFVAPLDRGMPITNAGKDLEVVLGYLGPSGHVEWAQRLPIASS